MKTVEMRKIVMNNVKRRLTPFLVDNINTVVAKVAHDYKATYHTDINTRKYNPMVTCMTIRIWTDRVSELNAGCIHIIITEDLYHYHDYWKDYDKHHMVIVVLGSESKGSPILFSNTYRGEYEDICCCEFLSCYLPRILESTIRMVS